VRLKLLAVLSSHAQMRMRQARRRIAQRDDDRPTSASDPKQPSQPALHTV